MSDEETKPNPIDTLEEDVFNFIIEGLKKKEAGAMALLLIYDVLAEDIKRFNPEAIPLVEEAFDFYRQAAKNKTISTTE